MNTINIQTKKRSEFIDITREVQRAVNAQAVNEGACIVFCPHTTAGLTINENADPAVKKDILNHLEELAPEDRPYSHSEGNSDSHIKSFLVGSSLNIIIENKQLALGTWQGIYFCEFDGPRSRSVYVKVIGG